MRVLITGAAGFIGSAITRNLLRSFSQESVPQRLSITAVDSLMRPVNWCALEDFDGDCRLQCVTMDVRDSASMAQLLDRQDVVIHCAAQSSVDRSFTNVTESFAINVDGSRVVAEMARNAAVGTFIHFSTDEVYGEQLCGQVTESQQHRPTNPYSQSKSESEKVVVSSLEGSETRLIIVRPSNNYGLWQFPDNLIPKFATLLARGQTVPLYGNGTHRRSWVHADDTARAVLRLMTSRTAVGAYNIAGEEMSNLQVVQYLLDYFSLTWDCVDFVDGRPINDARYCNDDSKLRALGYRRQCCFADEIDAIIHHYALEAKKLNCG